MRPRKRICRCHFQALNLESYWKNIGAVFQDYQLFALPVSENVFCDEVTPTDVPKVLMALEKADFLDKLQELSNGLQTELTKEFYCQMLPLTPSTRKWKVRVTEQNLLLGLLRVSVMI